MRLVFLLLPPAFKSIPYNKNTPNHDIRKRKWLEMEDNGIEDEITMAVKWEGDGRSAGFSAKTLYSSRG